MYRGHKFVGEISEVFIETWVQDKSRKAVRKGNRENLLRTSQLQLSFGDILPTGYPQTMTLDLDAFHNGLKEAIEKLAANRCREVVIEWLRRNRDGGSNGDYQRSQEI